MDLVCPECGSPLPSLPDDLDATAEVVCSACGQQLRARPVASEPEANDPRYGTHPDLAAEIAAESLPAALYEPELLMSERRATELHGSVCRATELQAGDNATLFQADALFFPFADDEATTSTTLAPFAPPPLSLGVAAYFLRLGAAPGRERLVLERARTVFGRGGADIELDDPAVSKRHFQVDVLGREFFVRDLGSRHGTFLNGRAVRYAELLPGDELLAGATLLVFRTAADGLSRPAAQAVR